MLDAGNSGSTMRMLAGHPRGPPLHARRSPATIRCSGGRCAASSCRSSAWARASTRTTAGRRSRFRAPPHLHADRLRARGAERPGQERGPARRPARRRRSRACIEPLATRDHTERALRGVRCRRSTRADDRVAVTGGQRLTGRDARGAGRYLVGGVLDGGRRGAARLGSRHRATSA